MKTRTAQARNLLVAIMLIVAITMAYMPIVSFANSDFGSGGIEALKQALEDSREATDAAKAEMDNAEIAMKEAFESWQEKKTAAESAVSAVNAAELSLQELEKARDTAFEEKKKNAENEYSNALQAYTQAETAYKKAIEDLDAREKELEALQKEKDNIEQGIKKLEDEKKAAQDIVDALPSEIESANAEKDAAETQWAKDKSEAELRVAETQKAYDEKGYDFINSKIDALGSQYFTLDEMINICKGYSDDRSKFRSSASFNGKIITTLADAAEEENFLSIVKSNCKKDNLLMALDMVDESNEIRKKESKSIMGVSYQLMGVAMMSNSFTAYSTGHTLFNRNGKTPAGYSDTDSFWSIGPATTGNENLYYYSAQIRSAYQPYIGWYDEEKEAMQNAVASGKWPGLAMNMSTRYIWNNYPNLSSETNNAGYGQVGHYLTLKNEEYTTTGAAISYNSGNSSIFWKGRATQTFNDDTQNSISVQQCRNEINNAFAEVESALDQAEGQRDELEKPTPAVIAARERLQSKQQQLDDAKRILEAKTTALRQKHEELDTINSNIQRKEAEKKTAENTVATSEVGKDSAKTILAQKDTENTKAQKLNYNNPETFDDYNDLKETVKAVEDKESELKVVQETASNAQKVADSKRLIYEDAKSAYSEKKAIYDDVKQSLDRAEAEYKDAVEKVEAEKKAAEAEARARQKGADGTSLGAGASAEAADKAITSFSGDEGPKGSRFAPLMLKSSKQGKTNINLTWNRVSGATKYVVYGNACGKKNRMKRLAGVEGKTYNVKRIAKKLKKGTYHKFMIVALDEDDNVVSSSKVIHVATKGGKVGNHKSVTVSKKVLAKAKKLRRGKTLKINAKAVAQSKMLKVKKHRIVSYESDNSGIASVSRKGIVKAKKKGTCYIYAYAQNGTCRKIKVVVK